MGAVIPALIGGLAWAASGHAAPIAHKDAVVELRAAPPFELVRDGCGRGWHRDRWRDQMGRLALGPLYSERGSPRRLDCRLEPSLPRLARGTASVRLGLPIELKGGSLLAGQRS